MRKAFRRLELDVLAFPHIRRDGHKKAFHFVAFVASAVAATSALLTPLGSASPALPLLASFALLFTLATLADHTLNQLHHALASAAHCLARQTQFGEARE